MPAVTLVFKEITVVQRLFSKSPPTPLLPAATLQVTQEAPYRADDQVHHRVVQEQDCEEEDQLDQPVRNPEFDLRVPAPDLQ